MQGEHANMQKIYSFNSSELLQVQNIANVINTIIPLIIKEWHENTDLGIHLRKMLKLPSELENLLLSNKTKNITGHFNIQTIIQNENGNDIHKISDISPNFSVQDLILAYQNNEKARILSCTPNTQFNNQKLTCIPHTQSLLKEIKEFYFSEEKTIFYVITNREAQNFDSITKIFNIKIQEIVVSNLATDSSGNLINQKNNKIIQKCILDLNKKDIISIDKSIMAKLLQMSNEGNCINDIRTILLIQDNRLLSILNVLNNELLEKILLKYNKEKEEITNILNIISKHTIPSVVYSQHLRNTFSKYEILNYHILFKSSFIIDENENSNDFSSFNHFFDYLSTSKHDNIENEIENYLSSGILQIVNKNICKNFEYSFNNEKITNLNSSLICSLIFVNFQFYGPNSIQIQCNSKINQKKNYFIQPGLYLPEINEKSRFLIPYNLLNNPLHDQKQLNEWRIKLRKCFAENGALLISIDDLQINDYKDFNNQLFENLIISMFGGEPLQVTQSKNSVYLWDIKPIVNKKMKLNQNQKFVARSHTNEEFHFHTDASWEDCAPQAFALNIKSCDRKGGGLFALLHVENSILNHFSNEEINELFQINLDISVPPEFSEGRNTTLIQNLPILMGENRIRYRHDIIQNHTSKILQKLNQIIINSLNQQSLRLLPERSVVIVDNQRFLHYRTNINDSRRHLQRIRFNLPQLRSPKFDLFLIKKTNQLHCNNSSIITKNSKNVVDLIPKKDNYNLSLSYTKILLSHINNSKNIRCLNFSSEKIFVDILKICNIEIFDTCNSKDFSNLFDFNALLSHTSNFNDIAELAINGSLSLKNVKSIFFYGKNFDNQLRSLFKSLCSVNVEFFGFLGSVETGIYAFQSPKTIMLSNCNQSESEKIYQCFDDVFHVEITTPSNSQGNLLVTNFLSTQSEPCNVCSIANWASNSRKYFLAN